VAEGYPDKDEICHKCKRVFKNYHHFLRCDNTECPMKDGKGTLFEQWAKMDAAQAEKKEGQE
jgi:hypothetical protein